MLFSSSQAARRKYCALAAVFFTYGFLTHGTVFAHVILDSPIGGETLDGGFMFPIEWHPAVQHNTLDWDLWYSTTSSSGPWIEIAYDLPLGDPTSGSSHVYNWYVANIDTASAWVRVRQDNSGQDYFDVSLASFQIEAALPGDFSGDKIVDHNDLSLWENNFGTNVGAVFANGDADFDGDVDGADYLRWQESNSGQSTAVFLAVVPEPSSLILLLLAAVGFMSSRRL